MCIGWLKDHNAHADGLVERQQDIREVLLDVIRRIHRKVKTDKGEECGPLYEHLGLDAKGLIGSMIPIHHLAGVEVVFQVRLPEFSQNYSDKR